MNVNMVALLDQAEKLILQARDMAFLEKTPLYEKLDKAADGLDEIIASILQARSDAQPKIPDPDDLIDRAEALIARIEKKGSI